MRIKALMAMSALLYILLLKPRKNKTRGTYNKKSSETPSTPLSNKRAGTEYKNFSKTLKKISKINNIGNSMDTRLIKRDIKRSGIIRDEKVGMRIKLRKKPVSDIF